MSNTQGSPPGYPDVLALLRARSMPWIVLRTFSKAWGLAGLRVGYGLASDAALVQLLDRVRTPFNVNHAAQTAALAAWGDEAHMQHAVAETVRLREQLAARLRAAPGLQGIRIAPSATNFLFIDLGRPNGPVDRGPARARHHHQALEGPGVRELPAHFGGDGGRPGTPGAGADHPL